jgi:hypothetical protein
LNILILKLYHEEIYKNYDSSLSCYEKLINIDYKLLDEASFYMKCASASYGYMHMSFMKIIGELENINDIDINLRAIE